MSLYVREAGILPFGALKGKFARMSCVASNVYQERSSRLRCYNPKPTRHDRPLKRATTGSPKSTRRLRQIRLTLAPRDIPTGGGL
jgi:hypothetical protein